MKVKEKVSAIIQLLKDNAPLLSNKDLGEAIRLLAESLEKRK